MLNVEPHYLITLLKIIDQHLPECEVRAFGSRISGTAKSYSDLDLAIVCSQPIPTKTMSQLSESFSESEIPFRVDILDWNSISEDFKKVIGTKYEVIKTPR